MLKHSAVPLTLAGLGYHKTIGISQRNFGEKRDQLDMLNII